MSYGSLVLTFNNKLKYPDNVFEVSEQRKHPRIYTYVPVIVYGYNEMILYDQKSNYCQK